jgi:hypothetical protein
LDGAGRFKSLAVQSYILGALDFKAPNRYNDRLRAKENMIFQQIEIDNLIKLKSLRHNLHAAATSAGGERYNHHFDHATAECKGISELLFPWVTHGDDDNRNEYVKMWEDRFGVKMGSKEWDKLVNKYDKISELYLSKKRK